MKESILGYDVNSLSVDVCADRIFQLLKEGKRTWLACFNPHSYAVALKDKVFAHALKDADWLVPDGAGVVLASRLLGGSIRERITGSDIFRELSRRLNDRGGASFFFLGATEGARGVCSGTLAGSPGGNLRKSDHGKLRKALEKIGTTDTTFCSLTSA